MLGLLAPAHAAARAARASCVVAGFLLVNKVYSPQYVLWLLPLAVLARPRWRDQLVWQAGELLLLRRGVVVPRRTTSAAGGGGDAGFYWLAIVVRVAAELYLVAVVVRDVLLPEHDPVRGRLRVDRRPATRAEPVSRAAQLTTTRSNVVAV